MSLVNLAVFLGLTVPFFLLTVWALVDVTMKVFPAGSREKAGWWILALVPFIGWLIYFLFGARRGKKSDLVA